MLFPQVRKIAISILFELNICKKYAYVKSRKQNKAAPVAPEAALPNKRHRFSHYQLT